MPGAPGITEWPLAPRFQPDYFIPEELEPALIEGLGAVCARARHYPPGQRGFASIALGAAISLGEHRGLANAIPVGDLIIAFR
jgi:hypothetical protein